MNDTDAVRGDAVRRLGRFARLAAVEAWHRLVWPAVFCALVIVGLFAASVGLAALLGWFATPWRDSFIDPKTGAPMAMMDRGGLTFALLLAAVFALLLVFWFVQAVVRSVRRAWLAAARTGPEYGLPYPYLRGWWTCTQCSRDAPPYVKQCNGLGGWHPAVLRPERDR